MKILRFMHAGYQTIRRDLLIIRQKSFLGIFENWRSYGKKLSKKYNIAEKIILDNF